MGYEHESRITIDKYKRTPDRNMGGWLAGIFLVCAGSFGLYKYTQDDKPEKKPSRHYSNINVTLDDNNSNASNANSRIEYAQKTNTFPYYRHPTSRLHVMNTKGGYYVTEGEGSVTWEGDKPSRRQTYAKITWPDGSFYMGDQQNGQLHGTGFMQYANGESYFGEFSRGKANGYGIKWNEDGTCTHGKFEDWNMTKSFGTLNLRKNTEQILPWYLDCEYNLQLVRTKGEYQEYTFKDGTSTWSGDLGWTVGGNQPWGYGIEENSKGREIWGFRRPSKGFSSGRDDIDPHPVIYVKHSDGTKFYGDSSYLHGGSGYGVQWNDETGYYWEGLATYPEYLRLKNNEVQGPPRIK